jgi:chromosome segregation protein
MKNCSKLTADPEDAAILELNEQWPLASWSTKHCNWPKSSRPSACSNWREELQQAGQAQQQAQGELQRLKRSPGFAGGAAAGSARSWPGRGRGGCVSKACIQRPRLAEGLRVEAGWELAGGNRARAPTCRPCCWMISPVLDFSALEQANCVWPARPVAVRAAPAACWTRSSRATTWPPGLASVRPVESLEQALAARGATGGRRKHDQPRRLLGRSAFPACASRRRIR